MPMTIEQFLVILTARWRSIALVFAGVVFLVLTVSLLLPKRYTGTASVVLDVRTPDRAAGGPNTPLVVTGMLAPSYMTTQVQVVTSERVARGAIRALGLQNDAELKAAWIEDTEGKGDFEAWLAVLLQKQLDVIAARDSNIIDIAYSSKDPAQAAAVANAFMQSYIDTTLELKVEPARAYKSFFDERAKRLRQDLEAAQGRLSRFQKANQILVSPDRMDVETARLANLTTQLVELQASAAQNEGKRAQAGGARQDQLPEVISNPLVSQLSASVANEEARLKELTSRYGPRHPQLIEQRARLAEVQSKLQAATARATGSVSVNTTVNQAQIARMEKLLNEQRAKVLKLQGLRDEGELLRRDVEIAQTAYSAMEQHVVETGVESENTSTNVSVLKRATEPATPSSPRLLRNLAAAMVLGMLLGLANALVREMRDRRVRTHADIEVELGQPLMLTLPKAAFPRGGKGRTRTRSILDNRRPLPGLRRTGAATSGAPI
ncbi:MAG: chain length determinant protein EpsF [Burkholderiales bacterium]